MTEAGEETSVAQKIESDHLDPWIEDGNIVLAVQGKYFRVHRSILSSHSEVFKDMFDCTQLITNEGEKSEELIEQCPVIHLHDAAGDVQIMLKAMYDRSYPSPYYEKVPLSIISVFLRLGEKYAIGRLMDEAKARLCCVFEPSLSGGAIKMPLNPSFSLFGRAQLSFAFESSLSVATKMASTHTLQLFPCVTGGDPHNFLVMNLLEEMDLRSPLPLTMYQCVVSCPLTAITDGYKFNGSVCSLSHGNMRAWILMKNILENFRVQLGKTLRVSNNCVVQSSCVLHVRRLWSDDITISQPFGPWRQEWDKLFCDACKADLNAWRNSAIQKAWNQVPTAFGFESWAGVATQKDDVTVVR